MSMHKMEHSPELIEDMNNHGMVIDKPSQLSDSFRAGWIAGKKRGPKVDFWFGAMPESNGKQNWTSMVFHPETGFFDSRDFIIMRTEYPDRATYELDNFKYVIGLTEEEPDILAYETDEKDINKCPKSLLLLEEMRKKYAKKESEVVETKEV